MSKLNIFTVLVCVACGLIVLACFWSFKDGQVLFPCSDEIVIRAVYAAGDDPGLPDRGRVVSVTYEGKDYSRDWYLSNWSKLEVDDTIWVSPDLLFEEESGIQIGTTEVAKY